MKRKFDCVDELYGKRFRIRHNDAEFACDKDGKVYVVEGEYLRLIGYFTIYNDRHSFTFTAHPFYNLYPQVKIKHNTITIV